MPACRAWQRQPAVALVPSRMVGSQMPLVDDESYYTSHNKSHAKQERTFQCVPHAKKQWHVAIGLGVQTHNQFAGAKIMQVCLAIQLLSRP